jgi:hypothetical protein
MKRHHITVGGGGTIRIQIPWGKITGNFEKMPLHWPHLFMAALAGNLLTKGLVEQRNFRAAPLQSCG